MLKRTFNFNQAACTYYLSTPLSTLKEITDPKTTVLLVDENLLAHHAKRFRSWKTIVLKSGEQYKVQATADAVIEQLINFGTDRNSTLVGIGGGVTTDLTGYIASIYMRGIRFGFVPSTILSMVDASIGGKNGVDWGVYKNIVGTIRQPGFILFDPTLLKTLPDSEWQSGFAEIIKHACIRDATMFGQLERSNLQQYQRDRLKTTALIERNVLLKTKIVLRDEYEIGERKQLNFGHTLGHALENQYQLSHGQAISIGMAFAALLSRELLGFSGADKLITLLEQYHLPTFAKFNKDKVIKVLKMDKKKIKDSVNFVLLEKLGKAVIEPIAIDHLYRFL